MRRNAGWPVVLLAAVSSAGLLLAVAVLGWSGLTRPPAPRVSVALDWYRFQALALEAGVSPLEAAAGLPELGVRGLVLREATLEHLAKGGRIRLEWGWEWLARRRVSGQTTGQADLAALDGLAARLLVRASDPGLAAWLGTALERRWPYGAPSTVTLGGEAWFALPVPAPAPADPALGDGDPAARDGRAGAAPLRQPRELRAGLRPSVLSAWTEPDGPLGVLAGGYPEDALTTALGFLPDDFRRLAGLDLTLFPRLQGHPATGVPADAASLPPLPPGTVVIVGRDAFGAGPAAAGTPGPEAVSGLARRLADGDLRLGVVWQEPAAGLDRLAAAGVPLVKVQPFWPTQRIEDTLGAVRERRARLIAYDDFEDLPGGAVPGDPAGQPLRALAAALKDAGYAPAAPAALGTRPAPPWAAAASTPAGFLLREVLALGVALAVPTLATLAVLPRGGGGMRNPWTALALATGVSAAGGLVVAALLADPVYVAQIRQFRGVRLALLAPAVVVGAVVLWRGLTGGTAGMTAGAAATLLRLPLRRSSAAAAVLLAGGLALAGMRAGNLPAVGVPEWELRLRRLLERLLFVRPRTKEFLVGHPALALAGAGGWGPVAAAGLAVLVALGQASVLNTFAHVHTPLGISLARVVIGLGLGAAGGWLALQVLGRVRRWRPPPPRGEAADARAR